MFREKINETIQSKNTLMFITAILFMSGILSYFNNIGLITSATLTVISIFLILKQKLPIKHILFWILIFYIGYINASLRTNETDNLNLIAPIDAKIEGRITSIPQNINDKIKFFIDVEKVNNEVITGKTYATLNSGTYTIGDKIELNAKIRQPFKAGNPSQFDYGKYLRNYNAFTTTYGTEAEIIQTKLPIKWLFMQKLNNVRNNILKTHSKYLGSPNLEILGGIVFGDDAVAPPEYIKTNFINSGLLHILAASGMNVAFIFGFWFFIMRFLKIPYRMNIIGGLIMVILYTLMTGLGASVLRAALMLLFIQIGKLVDRDAHSVSLLSFVALLLLLYNPAYINDVGFQLSFIVTFGLLTSAKVIFDKVKNINMPDFLKAGILIPIVAQIWVAPIQMFYFNTISTYSILANIITIPFLSVISFGGFISSILAIIKPIADFVCMFFDFILKYMLDCIVIISNYFSQLPNSQIETTHPNVFQIFLYYIILLLITLLIKSGYNKKLLTLITISFVILLLSNINIPNRNLEIITFDVQNADALLIKTPKNKYFLIDSAKLAYKSSNSTAKLVIIKYLKDRGIKNIEGLILTHFDLDHAGGAIDLINHLNIKKVYVNSKDIKNQTTANIFKTINENNIPYEIAENNKTIYNEDNLKIETHINKIKNNDNESSVITLLTYKNFDTLFMGDAGSVTFNKIKQNIPNNIEVLKVGHHGGKNVVNTEMLTHLDNDISIISTGPNSFGHPNKYTLNLLDNTKIYRTDKHNSIKITSDGNKYKVYTFNRLNKKYRLIEIIPTK